MTHKSFSWQRVRYIAVGMGLAVLLATVVPLIWLHGRNAWREWQTQRIDPLPATNEEQAAIVTMILTTAKFGPPPPPPLPPKPGTTESATAFKEDATKEAASETAFPVLFVVEPLAHCDSKAVNLDTSGCAGFKEVLVSPVLKDVPLRLRRELIALGQNERPPLRLEISGKIAHPIRANDVAAVFKGDAGWSEFYRRWPSTAGYVQMTRAALSEDRQHALIYVSTSCGGLCGWGNLYYLDRAAAGWSVRKKVGIWIS